MNISSINNSLNSNNNIAFQSDISNMNKDGAKFSELLDYIQNKNTIESSTSGVSTLSSSQILKDGKINGDYTSGFDGFYTSESDKTAKPVGAAANQANSNVQNKTIDKTSKLYEKAMELENYFVKQMLSSMRKTIMKSKENDFAQDTYEDMLWDEYSTALTKNAGFGLADQIYNQLV